MNNLINLYVKEVENSINILEDHSVSFGFYQEIRASNIGDDIYFQFHGTGCLFILNGSKLEFEMPDFDEGVIEIDMFFLYEFYKSKQLTIFNDEDDFKKKFYLYKEMFGLDTVLHEHKLAINIDFSFDIFGFDVEY